MAAIIFFFFTSTDFQIIKNHYDPPGRLLAGSSAWLCLQNTESCCSRGLRGALFNFQVSHRLLQMMMGKSYPISLPQFLSLPTGDSVEVNSLLPAKNLWEATQADEDHSHHDPTWLKIK